MTLDLDELERKAEAATPGPWEWVGGMLIATNLRASRGYGVYEVVLDPHNCTYPSHTPASALGSVGVTAEARKAETAEFIAAANPSAVLALIERVRALDTALDERTRELQAALKVIGGGK